MNALESLSEEALVGHLARLALLKGKEFSPEAQLAYAEVLQGFPGALVLAALATAALDPSPFIPPVGALIAAAVAACPGVADSETAWQRARAVLRRYHPQTRPDPGGSGDPAVDAALADLGGAASVTWDDAEGEGFRKREFLDRYAAHARTPRHLAWALSTGGELPPPVVRGLEGRAAVFRGPGERGATLTGASLAPALPEPAFTGTAEAAAANVARLGAAVAALRMGQGPEPALGREIPRATVTTYRGKEVVVYDRREDT
jgi:hypothetical protein